jgi:hypothetical protein
MSELVPGPLRSVVFSLLLGFHNAMEQDAAGLDDQGRTVRAEYREPARTGLDDPARCFFWGGSSLAN